MNSSRQTAITIVFILESDETQFAARFVCGKRFDVLITWLTKFLTRCSAQSLNWRSITWRVAARRDRQWNCVRCHHSVCVDVSHPPQEEAKSWRRAKDSTFWRLHTRPSHIRFRNLVIAKVKSHVQILREVAFVVRLGEKLVARASAVEMQWWSRRNQHWKFQTEPTLPTKHSFSFRTESSGKWAEEQLHTICWLLMAVTLIWREREPPLLKLKHVRLKMKALIALQHAVDIRVDVRIVWDAENCAICMPLFVR